MTNPGRSRFAPRLLPTFVAAVAVIAFSGLGAWQLGRAAEKRAFAEDFARAGPALEWRQLPAAAPRYQRVTVSGRYEPDRQFLLDNMTHAGVAGVEVLTPLLLDDGRAVLVNRGWRPFGATRGDLPAIAVNGAARRIAGRIDELPRPGIRLASPPATGWPRLVQFPRIEELSTALGRELDARVILLDASQPDGYLRDWTVRGTTPDRHLGYAVQWFAFAALAAAMWLALGLRKSGETQ
ncbi:MAG TPA: SURF1 family protein [Steroidobacteraceae bacterium]